METEILVIHRCNVKSDLLNYFSNDTLLQKVVSVRMVDARGTVEKDEGIGL